MKTRLKLATALPYSYFHCNTFNCDLPHRDCLMRQRSRGQWNGATTTTKGVKRFRRPYIPAHLAWCASGRCEQGKEIAKTAEPVVPLNIRRSGMVTP